MSEAYNITEHGEIIDTPMLSAGTPTMLDERMVTFYDRLFALQSAAPIELGVDKGEEGGRVGRWLTYAGIMRATRPLFKEYKFIVTHGMTRSFSHEDKTRIYPVYTDLILIPSGMFRRWQVGIPLPKLDAQSVGAAMTYGKRYTLLAALGIATTNDPQDDDGASITEPDINEDFIPSDLLIELRDEVVAIKKSADLAKWGNDAKNKKRIARLNQTEDAFIRTTYSEHKRRLLASETES